MHRGDSLGFARDRRIAFGLPWGCLGFYPWLALGLARDRLPKGRLGIVGLLGLPRESRARPLGIALGVP